ncbi:ATP-binding protein [Burkholderia ubonensis]|uniref:ATP-binding protein n=1 Tax=Burkholderia ubonensis TaxID=101571 RepID=UPI0012FA341B|nr:AAA family ATPase [Burkholderia ubonensis]
MKHSATSMLPLSPAALSESRCPFLFRELERIDLCLQRYICQHRERLDAHVLDGFLLDEEDIHLRTETPCGVPHWMMAHDERCEHFLFQPECSGGLLASLAKCFELTAFETDVLLLGLLLHFDSRYFSLFAALQRNGPKNLPTFELALHLFGGAERREREQRLSLLPQSPLLKHQLITTKKIGEWQGEGWAQSQYQTSAGVYHYLAGNFYLSSSLSACARWYPPEVSDGLNSPVNILSALQTQEKGPAEQAYPVLMLEGPPASGRLAAVRAAASQLNRSVLSLDMALLTDDRTQAQQTLVEAMREARMREAILVLRLREIRGEGEQGIADDWTEHLQQPGLRVVILGDRHTGCMRLPGVAQLLLELPVLSRREKEQLLSQSLTDDFEPGLDVAAFGRRFSFTRTALPLILQEAKGYRTLRDASGTVSVADLNRAFRLHARKNFGRLAQRKEPRRTFDDLVVADELKAQLTEILIAARHRDAVLEQGFAAKIGYGTGVSALFCGDSGTGKTLAAEVIAGQLEVDLIKVDLSTVVNKYIGETEKNLSRIFDLAEADAGVLFFDEADALFGKRSNVTDSKDRHANIEVAYLLQRLENHSGLVILSTNNRNHLDDAFSRRFTFIARFDFPDASLREKIWRGIWPEKIGLSPDIDFSALAKDAELTGANIRNIALLSAWLAAEKKASRIDECHIRLAMTRELEKIGRLSL